MNFPFSAIVGQQQLKTALLLCAVDPTLGGVLIRGDKGTAKSTAARALPDILPPIERVEGCAFNCTPGLPCPQCETCMDAQTHVRTGPVPFVTLPLGATEDRVIGTLDIKRALSGAGHAFQPGLLASAHRGILYIDEVNLLPDHLVDVLLDAAAMGVNSVQREGLSVTHPARFTLVGTMNLEEGDLRPQLLDRFGLMVEVTAPRDKQMRTDVVRRRIAFESNPAAYAASWKEQQEALRGQLINAQQSLKDVELEDEILDLISHLCCEFEVSSLRADIVMHKASRALAALDGRTRVTPDDVRKAAELVLPHRRRRKPFEQPGLDQERLDDLIRQACPPEPNQSNDTDAESGEESQPTQADTEEEGVSQQMFAAGASGDVRSITLGGTKAPAVLGRRSTSMETARGRMVRAVPDENPDCLAIGATLRSAALRGPAQLQVTTSDLHRQIKTDKSGNLILFVVDASGSMAAQRRMEAVKGAVLSLLTDAYQRRDEVAVISFRGESAHLLLSPTRSVDLAEQELRELPTGGRTPLPHALQLAQETLARTDNGRIPLLVLMTDGKANVSVRDAGDPWREALDIAGLIAERNTPALVLDTEAGYMRLGKASQLAMALGAECLTLEELSAENLALTIRKRIT